MNSGGGTGILPVIHSHGLEARATSDDFTWPDHKDAAEAMAKPDGWYGDGS